VVKRIVLAALWFLCVGAAALAALRMLWAILVAPDRAFRLAVSFDQLANAALNGNEDETISSRAARAQINGRRWGCVLCGLLDRIDPGHCFNALETRFLR